MSHVKQAEAAGMSVIYIKSMYLHKTVIAAISDLQYLPSCVNDSWFKRQPAAGSVDGAVSAAFRAFPGTSAALSCDVLYDKYDDYLHFDTNVFH